MASNTPLCSICIQLHVTNPSTDWCPICEEALCRNCRERHGLAKASKDHKVIPMSDYNKLPQNIQDIKLYCEDHGDKYQLFCQSHDLPICSKCIEDHAKCGDVIPLDKITENAKKSTSFKDLIQSIKDIEENIRCIRQDRERNADDIENQRHKCKEHIETVRKKINEHLDKLQADLLEELSSTSEKVVMNMKSLLDDIEQQENQIAESKELIQNIEAYASDLQTFLGTKVIESEVIKEERYLRSLLGGGSLDNVSIVCEIDKVIQQMMDVSTFGSVRINTKPCDVKFVQKKAMEAQVIQEPTGKSIHSINCTLSQTISKAYGHLTNSIRGCCMMSNGQLLFACRGTGTLQVFHGSGLFDFSVNLMPNNAFDVTSINDRTVAVTSNKDYGGVSIVDLSKKIIMEFIQLPGAAYGITSTDTCLIVCVASKCISFINREDYALSSIDMSDIEKLSYIAENSNSLYFSSPSKHAVTCCTMTGQIIWRYNNQGIIVRPYGLQVDNWGNVFVVGVDSHNLVIISADGKEEQQLLKDSRQLKEPTGLYFARYNNTLLLTNRKSLDNFAMLCDIKY